MNKFKPINVLILGSGGREHALAWKIKSSPLLNKLYVGPGNSGTAEIANNINININNVPEVKKIIKTNNIKLLIIGPEAPLVEGMHDEIEKDHEISDLIIIGPKKKGAMLEGSKSFAKKFMKKYHIPTANYKSFNSNSWKNAIQYLKESLPPYVIKVDGLAAGKGVFICKTFEEASSVIKNITIKSSFGNAGNKIVIESFLEGIELSVFILTNGKDYKILPTAKDYKRVGENDTGLNTGGMGAISPFPFLNEELLKKIKINIIEPTLEGLKKEKIDYQGFIFFGLMNVQNNPFVIEYNVRLGDPETQTIMPRIKSDLLELMVSIEKKTEFKKHEIDINNFASSTVIIASGGYPEKYTKGYSIVGLNNLSNCISFHAGILKKNNKTVTNGGRVLAITALGDDIKEAREIAYRNVEKVCFENLYYRRDIGLDVIK